MLESYVKTNDETMTCAHFSSHNGMNEFSRKCYSFLFTLHINMQWFKKHYNVPHKSTYSNPRRPTTLHEKLSLKWCMRQKYTNKKQVNSANASNISEKQIGGRSVLAIDH